MVSYQHYSPQYSVGTPNPDNNQNHSVESQLFAIDGVKNCLGRVDIYVRCVRNRRGEVPSPIDQRGMEPPDHTG